MEQKIDMKQDRENEKFWQYWMKSESTLVVGNELNDIPKVKEKVANKLGLHKRSITPTTLEKVVFDDLEEDLFYREIYKYADNSITRFGININGLNYSNFQELVIYNKKLQLALDTAGEKISNISGATNYQLFVPKYIELINSEKFILKDALGYMFDKKQKLVLVDIFPRESSKDKKTGEPAGRINLEALDTHTVLLYKTVEDKVLAIDPNNPMFSAHLSQFKDFTIQTECSNDQKYKIYSRPDGSKTGFVLEEFRDCIDIAVKLGLLLNKDVTPYKTIEEVMGSDAVNLITNNSKINGMDFRAKELIRLKQSSDIEQVNLCNLQMQGVNKKITEENSRFEKEKKLLEDNHYSLLNT